MVKRTDYYVTKLQMERDASLIMYVYDRKNRIHIAKNRRYPPIGDINQEQFIDIALCIIARQAHHNTAKVFQEGLVIEMKEALKKVLEKNSLKVENKNDNTI